MKDHDLIRRAPSGELTARDPRKEGLGPTNLALIFLLFFFSSKLRIPGLDVDFDLYYVFLCFVLYICVLVTITKQKISSQGAGLWILLIFLLVLVVTISIRGIGLKVLCSSQVGGIGYITLFLTALAIFLIPQLQCNIKSMKLAIIALLAGTSIPVLADTLALTSGTDLSNITAVSPDVKARLQGGGWSLLFVRYRSAWDTGLFLYIAYLGHHDFSKNSGSIRGGTIVVTVVSLIFIGLSGHRIAILIIIMVSIIVQY